ncbi:helix-turn-helix DNA binding domain protein [Gordonia phage Budski]|nr:helix-turn-helix DNA binding domain protein [Gordonia phage Budski]
MTAVEPVPVEPNAVWRMLTNDWPRDKVATLLHMSQAQILKAEQVQNVALRGIDQTLIADPMIGPPKPRGTQ